MTKSISMSDETKRKPRTRAAVEPTPPLVVREAVMEEARLSGLLEGAESEHVSMRVPPALLEAAKRTTGITSTIELGTLALAMLAQPDPVVAVMKTKGRLGKDHTLDY